MQESDIIKENYCVLYDLEMSPASGELPFYFTSEQEKEVELLIFDEESNLVKEVDKKICKIGGNIVRFDSRQLPNGIYYYCLKTENQKVMKKMSLKND